MSFENKVALIVGASGGIGAASARALHEAGACVALADIDPTRGSALASSLGERAFFRTVDVRDDADCHIGLLESVHVKNGERYIAWSTDMPKVE